MSNAAAPAVGDHAPAAHAPPVAPHGAGGPGDPSGGAPQAPTHPPKAPTPHIPLPAFTELNPEYAEQLGPIVKPCFGRLVRLSGALRQARRSHASAARSVVEVGEAPRLVKVDEALWTKWKTLDLEMKELVKAATVAHHHANLNKAEAALDAYATEVRTIVRDILLEWYTTTTEDSLDPLLVIQGIVKRPKTPADYGAFASEAIHQVTAVKGDMVEYHPMSNQASTDIAAWFKCIDFNKFAAASARAYTDRMMSAIADNHFKTALSERTSKVVHATVAKQADAARPAPDMAQQVADAVLSHAGAHAGAGAGAGAGAAQGVVNPAPSKGPAPRQTECEGGWLLACSASRTIEFVGGGVDGGVSRASLGKLSHKDGGFDSPSALTLVPGLGLVVRDRGNGGRFQVFG
jgi:hypothetical protein